MTLAIEVAASTPRDVDLVGVPVFASGPVHRSVGLSRARLGELGFEGKLGEVLKSMGTTLEGDPRIRAAINQFARRAVAGLAASYGGSIVKLVSETIRSWDARTITARLEAAVGRDLQYIRINGTLVGGLVGVILHALDGI